MGRGGSRGGGGRSGGRSGGSSGGRRHSSSGRGSSRSSSSSRGYSSRSYSSRSHSSRSYSSGYSGSTYYGTTGGSTGTIRSAIMIMIMFFVLCSVIHICSNGVDVSNTTNRKAIESGYAFDSGNSITDDLGWIMSKTSTNEGLRYFHKKTGVQPAILILNGDGMTDQQMEDATVKYAEKLYPGRDDVFVYACWDTDMDSDYNDDKYYTWSIGALAGSVMNNEALEIFWQYHDYYFYDSNKFPEGQEDDMYAYIYKEVADTIMEKSNTMADAAIMFIVVAGIVSVGIVVIILVNKKNKREKEKAAETERILNADLDSLTSSAEDDLVNKYE